MTTFLYAPSRGCPLSDDADGDRYWTAVAARAIARHGSVPNGLVIADVLRRQPTPADLMSLADAAALLSYSPPPDESRHRSSSNRGLSHTLETITDRHGTMCAIVVSPLWNGLHSRKPLIPSPVAGHLAGP
ncbi:hypothetical protein C486_14037 [Natrinema gari JCM 14663]|uniref:Uncharacterized protein n=1 Tax=Natrinema gari JCM 14663 TaxID=1230459 RepID=L9YX16_9EURY|nr:hypothetical protein C486_14037 [Natrinema gari JCM 14663]